MDRFRITCGSRRAAAAALILLVASCGGGGTGGTLPESVYAAKCASPRSGIDAATGKPYPDVPGTVDDEKKWLRAWTDDLYLWYREVPSVDPAAYATPAAYFAVLKTQAVTASGKPKDRFHFTYPTAEWEALSQSGVQAGYGAQWAVLSPAPPREVVVAYIEPGSPAAAAGLARGAQVLAVDGVDLANGTDVTTLNAGLFPSTSGESHSFSILDSGAAVSRTVVLSSANVVSHPVQDAGPVAGHPTVGYMLFNDHLATAEKALFDAITSLRTAGIADLVVDMRYNGGGYLVVASQLAYMLAGPTVTSGKAFEREAFNDKHPTTDPVTGEALTPFPFVGTTVGLSEPSGTPLPYLTLSRVFVLTGPDTCSASESVINGLRGVDFQVVQVGSTTCGKPYAFYPQDNCGTTYFSIEMQGQNAKGFGDYGDGFVPGGAGAAGVPGCQVADDFGHALGDPAEALLAAAVGYMATGTCPAASVAVGHALGAAHAPARGGIAPKSPWQTNRMFRR